MPPTLKKWGAYWLELVRVCVFMYFMSVCMYGASIYCLETLCMDSSWKNSRNKLFFPELSPLVKLRPFEKQGMKLCDVFSQKVLKLETCNLCQLIWDDE